MKTPLPGPHDNDDRLRLTLAVTLSLLILFAFTNFFAPPAAPEQVKTEKSAPSPVPDIRPAAEVLAQTERIPVRGSRVTGSISLKGGRLDDLRLNEHFETIEKKDKVVLLAPSGTAESFYAESGFVAGGNLRDFVVLHQKLGLRALAGTGLAE